MVFFLVWMQSQFFRATEKNEVELINNFKYMEEYVNLLSIFGSFNPEQVIQLLLKDAKRVVEISNTNTFFVTIMSADNANCTKRIFNGLSDLNLRFTFIHFGLVSGSYVIPNGIDDGTVTKIREIISIYNPNE